MSDQLPHNDFAHLHLHSVYSLLDGAIRIPDLMQEVKRLGMSSVAITDHGNMFGVIDFYSEAKKAGVKPIIGCEFYVAPGSRTEKRMVEKVADGQAYHLVLLAKDTRGYKNLIKLASKAYTEGFYRKPRIDYDLLSSHTDGLVCLTACLAGEVNRKLYNQQTVEATDLAGRLNEMFGTGNFYLEIQNHGIPEQLDVARAAVELGKRNGIPLVLTNDSHFLRREDQQAQDIMLRIQLGKTIDDPMEFGFNQEFYVKSPAEMALLYPELPEAFRNTMRISEMTDLHMDFGHPLLPDFRTPDNLSLRDYLEKIARNGLRDRFQGSEPPQKYRERLEYELSVIAKMGYEGYFLIVADFIGYARKSGIPVGPGRGSAAGSLVAFATGITDIDPLRYDLLFERFLNPSRNEMPDIDIDFCRDRREEVIRYVVDKYGEDHVSQIITFGTLSAKAVIKDVARVLGISFSETNSLTRHLPDTPGIRLEDAVKNSPEVRDYFNASEKGKTLWQVAQKLEGIPRNPGKHAAGVVIAPAPLDEIVPLARDNKSDSVITQFEKNPLEKVGLVKMDFLGLKNLTVIDNAVKEIQRRRGIKVNLPDIPLDDSKAFELLQKGQTKGIFQVEKSGITRLLMRAQPRQFEDIVACIALYRPGPLQSGMAEAYIKRKNGEVKVVYPHKDLEPVLKDTFGTFVYQEQIMLISQIIGGFSMSDADTLRKAMGKKNQEIMARMKEKFISGAQDRGHAPQWAGELYDDMAKFAEYGFNKSHSAAYGLITYQTAWLKANYTVEFMKATLDADMDDTEKLIGFIYACREMGIEILPPDINESEETFTILNEKQIRYGLLGIKGIGRSAVEGILEARRQDGRFRDLAELAGRVDSRYLNRKTWEALIFSGALDSFNFNRSSVFASIDGLLAHGQSAGKDRLSGQESLFGGEEESADSVRINVISDWSEEHKLANEKSALGLYLSSHPLERFQKLLPHTRITPIIDIDDGESAERKVVIAGVVESVETVNTRRGTTFTSVTLSDLSDRVSVRIYSNLLESVRDRLTEGNVVVMECRVNFFREGESVTANITASSVESSEKIETLMEKSLHIRIDGSVAEFSRIIRDVKNLMLKFKGDCPVFFYYRDPQGDRKVMKAHARYNVSYEAALTRQLAELTGGQDKLIWRIGEKLVPASVQSTT